MATLNLSPEDYQEMKLSSDNYPKKLENQSREIQRLLKDIKDVWNGDLANTAIDALEQSVKDFKRMAELSEPYANLYKRFTESIKVVYKDFA